ncbi:hypothetical protein MNBD_ALPHA06-1046 [hydrothermal vent metagenome]|uniref:Lipid/polyisoprenoid-binding YceI-like domain-containing protein n=1 Tax=hydrothermal vent metagenome TaxID=652676 RepID=A0A3B0R7X4_9ZZZZ
MQNSSTIFGAGILALVLLFGGNAVALDTAVAGAVAGAVSGSYRNDRTHSSLVWKVMHKGLSKYTARFVDFEATLEFDADDPTKSQLRVVVDPASVRTDYPSGQNYKFAKDEDFDAALAGKNWFNSADFAEITFTATQIERLDQTSGHVRGDLKFLGVSKPVVLNVTLNGAKAKALGFSGHTTIKRSDFGLSRYVPMIADEVEIALEVEFYLVDQE